MTEALSDLSADQPMEAEIVTSEGPVHCTLEPKQRPTATASFVGLARGTAAFRDPSSGEIAHRPLYRNLRFFRAIRDAFVQSGCPLDNGTGHPGYRFAPETTPNDRAALSEPGALLLARYRPPPNRKDPNPPPKNAVLGSQFVIALADMSHLAGQVTVLGRCRDLDRVRTIARHVTEGQVVMLQEIVVTQEAPLRGATR